MYPVGGGVKIPRDRTKRAATTIGARACPPTGNDFMLFTF